MLLTRALQGVVLALAFALTLAGLRALEGPAPEPAAPPAPAAVVPAQPAPAPPPAAAPSAPPEALLPEPPIPAYLKDDERNTIEIFRRASRAVVFIRNAELRRDFFSRNVFQIPRGTGSGFVWDRQGHVVTNYHVLSGGNSFSVTLADGTSYDARPVGVEPTKDLAVLVIEAPEATLHPLELGSSADLVVGQKVLAIGNPFGLDQTLTTGVISALGREIQSMAGTPIEDVIQTDAPINPGNSGGPLLDSGGRLIGVNAAIFSPSGASAGIGFAVPVDTIRRIIPQLIAYGHVKRAGLGITVLPDQVTRRFRIRGVVVREVARGGPAERAGLRSIQLDRRGNVTSYDLIVAIDDVEIASYNDLFSVLDKRNPGDEVTLRFQRDGQEYAAKLELREIE